MEHVVLSPWNELVDKASKIYSLMVLMEFRCLSSLIKCFDVLAAALKNNQLVYTACISV